MPAFEDEFIELIFEGLEEGVASRLAHQVLGRSIDLPSADEGVVDVALARLEIAERTALGNAHVRVLRYGKDIYDVEINFLARDAEGSLDALIETLHEFAIRLADAHGVASFYAGIDPAMDEDTRFFTGTEQGPYM